jgi:hypothetical protein
LSAFNDHSKFQVCLFFTNDLWIPLATLYLK